MCVEKVLEWTKIENWSTNYRRIKNLRKSKDEELKSPKIYTNPDSNPEVLGAEQAVNLWTTTTNNKKEEWMQMASIALMSDQTNWLSDQSETSNTPLGKAYGSTRNNPENISWYSSFCDL